MPVHWAVRMALDLGDTLDDANHYFKPKALADDHCLERVLLALRRVDVLEAGLTAILVQLECAEQLVLVPVVIDQDL